MALTLIATFTPSAYLVLAAPPQPAYNPTLSAAGPQVPIANTLALPAGSSPASALITNIGKPGVVLLTTATATTTGTVAPGSTAMTVASGANIAVGQAVIGAGLNPGTFVAKVSGTAVTLSQPAIAQMTTAAVNFVVPVTLSTGMMVTAQAPISLAYASNTFISVISIDAIGPTILYVAVGV
jgi:hypothetical protein